jgi:hypothetical protein
MLDYMTEEDTLARDGVGGNCEALASGVNWRMPATFEERADQLVRLDV